MIDTPVLLGSGSAASETDANDAPALTITLDRAITPNALALLWVSRMSVSGGNTELPVVEGGGVDWELVDSGIGHDIGSAQDLYCLYRAQGPAPAGTTITVTPPAGSIATTAEVVEVGGVEVGGNGADAVVQHSLLGVVNPGVDTLAVQLNTIASENHGVVCFGGARRNGSTHRDFIAPSGFTSLGDTLVAVGGDTSNYVVTAQGWYHVGLLGPDPNIVVGLSGGTNAGAVAAVEIAAAGGPDPTTVSIDQSDPQQVEVGSTLQLSATVTNGDGATTWASDDEAVATVDASGLVSGVSIGSATITATNNGVSDSITINVEAAPVQAPEVTILSPPGNIAVTAGTVVLAVGMALDAVDGDLSAGIAWTSSEDGALGTGASAQIDTSGWSAGNRTITATATNAAELDGSDDFVLTIGEAPEPPEPEPSFDAARFAINAAGGIA